MISHKQALDALVVVNQWFEQQAMEGDRTAVDEMASVHAELIRPMPPLPPMDFAQVEADLAQAAERLEREIRDGDLFTVVGSWVPSRERWIGKYNCASSADAEALALGEIQATWEEGGMTGRAEFLISGTFKGHIDQADVGVNTSDR